MRPHVFLGLGGKTPWIRLEPRLMSFMRIWLFGVGLFGDGLMVFLYIGLLWELNLSWLLFNLLEFVVNPSSYSKGGKRSDKVYPKITSSRWRVFKILRGCLVWRKKFLWKVLVGCFDKGVKSEKRVESVFHHFANTYFLNRMKTNFLPFP